METTRLFKKLALKAFKANNNKVVDGNSSKANETVVNLFKNNKSKILTYMPNIKAMKELIFLIPNAKKAVNYLRQVFIKVSMLQNYNLKSLIWIETNTSGYAIGRILNQLNLNSNISSNKLNSNISDFS